MTLVLSFLCLQKAQGFKWAICHCKEQDTISNSSLHKLQEMKLLHPEGCQRQLSFLSHVHGAETGPEMKLVPEASALTWRGEVLHAGGACVAGQAGRRQLCLCTEGSGPFIPCWSLTALSLMGAAPSSAVIFGWLSMAAF